MMVQSNYCNRDFVIDHESSMRLRSGEFQSNLTHLVCVFRQKTRVKIIGVARRPKGRCPPKFVACLVVLCFERRCPKAITVAQVKIFDPPKTLDKILLEDSSTIRKCPSHIWNDVSFNCVNAPAWIYHTLSWLKRTYSRKAKISPESLLLWVFYHPIELGRANCSSFLIVTNTLCFPWTKNAFQLKRTLFSSLLQPNLRFLPILTFSSFLSRKLLF